MDKVYRSRRKDRICFDVDIEKILKTDFDFEANLALFDKKKVMAEIGSYKRGGQYRNQTRKLNKSLKIEVKTGKAVQNKRNRYSTSKIEIKNEGKLSKEDLCSDIIQSADQLNDLTFGGDIDDNLGEPFDFEANLLHFDKKKVMAEIGSYKREGQYSNQTRKLNKSLEIEVETGEAVQNKRNRYSTSKIEIKNEGKLSNDDLCSAIIQIENQLIDLTFGGDIDDISRELLDFEANLLLFNKEKVMVEIGPYEIEEQYFTNKNHLSKSNKSLEIEVETEEVIQNSKSIRRFTSTCSNYGFTTSKIIIDNHDVVIDESFDSDVIHSEEQLNDLCFGFNMNEILGEPFDFEANQLLFNKEEIFLDKLEAESYASMKNVLIEKCMTEKDNDSIKHYILSGHVCVAIGKASLLKLQRSANENGLTFERQNELFGKAVSEIALKEVIVSHRTNSDKENQLASVLIVCGSSFTGAAGLVAARYLASQGVKITLLIKENYSFNPVIIQDLQLFKLTGQHAVNDHKCVHFSSMDMVIVAVDSELELEEEWVVGLMNLKDLPIIGLNPPTNGISNIKLIFSVVPAWPVKQSESNGLLYVCNIGIPASLYNSEGIDYCNIFNKSDIVKLN